jgi:hypothetical protein
MTQWLGRPKRARYLLLALGGGTIEDPANSKAAFYMSMSNLLLRDIKLINPEALRSEQNI